VPLYEYECQKCHRKTEKIEKVDGPHLKKCPHCSGKVERMISRTSMQFKGTGWYVTDYASKGAKTDGDNSAKPAGGESKESPAKESATESSAKEASAKESSKDSGKDSGKETKKSEEKKPTKKR
jgi:putative FmdB family regulatory protein